MRGGYDDVMPFLPGWFSAKQKQCRETLGLGNSKGFKPGPRLKPKATVGPELPLNRLCFYGSPVSWDWWHTVCSLGWWWQGPFQSPEGAATLCVRTESGPPAQHRIGLQRASPLRTLFKLDPAKFAPLTCSEQSPGIAPIVSLQTCLQLRSLPRASAQPSPPSYPGFPTPSLLLALILACDVLDVQKGCPA